MDETVLEIVRAPAWQALVRRLDAAVTRDPRLAEARDVVLRPVELLQVMAADAYGALGDDVLRADRLRAMLFVAWPYVAVAVEARKLLAAKGPPASPDTTMIAALAAPAATSTLAWPEPQAYEPGVIDHAGLLVLALAAARVADPPFAGVFVASIEGLALAASAAEVLGRLDPRQPDAAALEVVLHTLYLIEAARSITRNEVLRPFAFDPVERGRWRCLQELMTGPLILSAVRLGPGWDGATSDEIVAVVPKIAGVGDKITVRVRGGNPLPDATVVFASASGPLRPAAAKLGKTTTDATTIEVVVPAGAVPGWIGFSRSDRIISSNKARIGLREQLAAQLEEPCVDGTARIVPAKALPDYGALATPRRRGLDRFEGGAPTVVYVGVTPERARPGEPVTVRWESVGSTETSLSVGGTVIVAHAPPSGALELTAPASDGDVLVEITPSAERGGRTIAGEPGKTTFVVDAPVKIAALEVTQGGRASPLLAQSALDVTVQLDAPVKIAQAWLIVGDVRLQPETSTPGKLTFTVPPALVRDGVSLTAAIEDRIGTRDTRTAGPLAMRAPRFAEIVVVRPAIVSAKVVIEPIDRDDALRLVEAAATSAGVAASVVELPWADDELAVLTGRPDGDSDPALLRVLEQLSRRALITPRLEHAIWLVLLPDATRAGGELRAAMLAAAVPVASIARAFSANAARAVAVATPAGLSRLFADLFPVKRPADKPIAVGPRLAILGTLLAHDVVIDDVRVDDRGEGPGAPVTSRLEAVTLDADGRELAQVPVRVLTESRPAALAVLVPVSAAVDSIVLRDEAGGVRKVIRRIAGALTITVTPKPGAFEWSWEHTRKARPTASLLLRRGGVETPVLEIDACATDVDLELPLWRFAGGDALGLYATDGWNFAEKTVISKPFENAAPVVLRRLGDGRFFADAPHPWSVTWLLDGANRGKGRTLDLKPGDSGVLELVARDGAKTVRDRIRIGR